MLDSLALRMNARDYWRNWFRWQRGRQGTGYDKLLLLANPFLIPFDLYLLKCTHSLERCS